MGAPGLADSLVTRWSHSTATSRASTRFAACGRPAAEGAGDRPFSARRSCYPVSYRELHNRAQAAMRAGLGARLAGPDQAGHSPVNLGPRPARLPLTLTYMVKGNLA
jgi:hypothetical protein